MEGKTPPVRLHRCAATKNRSTCRYPSPGSFNHSAPPELSTKLASAWMHDIRACSAGPSSEGLGESEAYSTPIVVAIREEIFGNDDSQFCAEGR